MSDTPIIKDKQVKQVIKEEEKDQGNIGEADKDIASAFCLDKNEEFKDETKNNINNEISSNNQEEMSNISLKREWACLNEGMVYF